MKNEKYIRWLYRQLPSLIESGVINRESSDKLQAHFGPVEEKPAYNLAFIVAGSLGAILIGGGIIMLFAYNWDRLSLAWRSVLSFAPLVFAQVIYGYVFFKQRDSVAWIEASSGFLMLTLAASIALISQTYHIEGSIESFLFNWMLLSIPLMYLLNASLPALFYLAGIASWSWNAELGQSVWYWAFLLAAIPHLYRNIQPGIPAIRSNLLGWALAITLAFAWFGVIDADQSIFSLLGTALLLSLFYLLGEWLYGGGEHLVQRPWRSFAIGGIFIMSMVLGYEWPQDIILNRNGGTIETTVNLVVLAVAAIAYFLLLWRSWQQKNLKNYWAVFFPFIIGLGLFLTENEAEFWAIALANLYLFSFGVYYMREGIQKHKLSLLNLGMFFLTALILARFFDADVGLVLKGIVFILLGVGFLIVNLVLSRRLQQSE